MFFVVFGDSPVDQVLGLLKGVALLDPEPVGLQSADDPFYVCILSRAVVAGPLGRNFKSSQGILKSLAGGLAAIIKA